MQPVTIAFDVMGSDHGPEEVVRGAAKLSLEAPHIHALLVGVQNLIDDALANTRHSGERIAVHVAEQAPGAGVDTPADLERVRALWHP